MEKAGNVLQKITLPVKALLPAGARKLVMLASNWTKTWVARGWAVQELGPGH